MKQKYWVVRLKIKPLAFAHSSQILAIAHIRVLRKSLERAGFEPADIALTLSQETANEPTKLTIKKGGKDE